MSEMLFAFIFILRNVTFIIVWLIFLSHYIHCIDLFKAFPQLFYLLQFLGEAFIVSFISLLPFETAFATITSFALTSN